MEATHDISVGGNRYVIGRFSAEIGSFLLNRLIKTFRKMIADMKQEQSEEGIEEVAEPEGFSENLIETLVTELDFEDFKNIQRHALAVVSRWDDTNPERPILMPIQLRTGVFAFKDLGENIDVVRHLSSKALHFNLAPFFTKTGLKAMMKGEMVSAR
jgi:hypothetical protein